ncbi:MAG: SCP2 sterol-binding domain-containing protein [Ruminococcus sp.]|nr:SCP2 sterol-binding domain-containing protein [Ruminococcus sp.]
MTYAEMFSEIKGRFRDAGVSNIKEHLAFQFNITGEGEGIFYVEVKDGKLAIEPYEYYDRDAIFICSADVLFKIADGKLDPVLAFTLRKLKVEGSIEKALRFKEIVDSKRK